MRFQFYEGGGIYRHVSLTATSPLAIVPWGVYAPSVIAPLAAISGTLDEADIRMAAMKEFYDTPGIIKKEPSTRSRKLLDRFRRPKN